MPPCTLWPCSWKIIQVHFLSVKSHFPRDSLYHFRIILSSLLINLWLIHGDNNTLVISFSLRQTIEELFTHPWPTRGPLEVKKPYSVRNICSEVSELDLTRLPCMNCGHAFSLIRFHLGGCSFKMHFTPSSSASSSVHCSISSHPTCPHSSWCSCGLFSLAG